MLFLWKWWFCLFLPQNKKVRENKFELKRWHLALHCHLRTPVLPVGFDHETGSADPLSTNLPISEKSGNAWLRYLWFRNPGPFIQMDLRIALPVLYQIWEDTLIIAASTSLFSDFIYVALFGNQSDSKATESKIEEKFRTFWRDKN